MKTQMSGCFPIIQLTEASVLYDEPMGTKDKFWCQVPAQGTGQHWLFKHPRQQPGNMEHLAEKIAYELARLIEVQCATVELAEFKGARGSVSLDIRAPGEALIHGNEIIAGRVDGYDLQKRRRTSDHTFERIRKAILEVCGGRCLEDLKQFAGYLVLDALIGNSDRHHENWAFLKREAGPTEHRLAPSFDHASSLGREMRDERRLLLLTERRIPDYLRKGTGAIYLQEAEGEAMSPLELVRRLAPRFPDCFRPSLTKIARVTDEALTSIVDQLPEEWISAAQRDFSVAYVKESRSHLQTIQL